MENERLCANEKCKKPLERKKNESIYRFERRKTCDKQCAGKLRETNRKKFGTKICKDCGGEFEKSPIMSPTRWYQIARCESCRRRRRFEKDNDIVPKYKEPVWKDTDGKPIKPGFYIF